ncbi:hypothetical protein A2774_04985 [Candidatus Roizmanbacteria bacterium RIFCSPHIGHO2_01_FULL_39_12c]|uniref:Uncharacterized protein n=1 Tax=Candidatus Roizmanbacteria bacterium RIFCSPHIGHO2_01_FULL_39_12c TaxID=1802031 RepID=A0A1F7G943_9BACT|nr:MAG: hypothetical protein A2774_04985 [Candidatus Roizmanbacteria bacterium RIFCSPHIGHO2_01_FULL_39_12c]OGK46490.1 MAG: hypothetical protein A2963_01840 [Candidatus Roizmanbacteria bacterium RIFCSPLOWO2_01_FULL_40_13]
MDNFNKILSFVLGLVVVIVFLAVITGRINTGNFRRTLINLAGKPRVTPTISISPFLSPTAVSDQNTTSYGSGARTPTSIPATGAPTYLLPVLFSTLSLGIYLKKRK